MGIPFDDCSEKAHANYYDTRDLNKRDAEIRQRRILLRDAMLKGGFSLYEYEWWHFDYGNVFWSNSTGRSQLYGPLFGDKEWPGL